MFKKVSWKRFFISTGIIATVLGAANDEFTPKELFNFYAGTIIVAGPVVLASAKGETK